MFYIKNMFTSLFKSWMGYHMNHSYIFFDTEQSVTLEETKKMYRGLFFGER